MAKTVFTNGCFDLIHPGHIDLLRRAKALGERLIVGLNSDESVRRMKGGGRPFMDQRSRKDVLLGLDMVDEVIIFDDLTPAKLISEILPDVLVKGGDWPIDQIVGADVVRAAGGEVHSLSLVDGYSSSKIVERIRAGTVSDVENEDGVAQRSLSEHIEVINDLYTTATEVIQKAADLLISTFASGNKVLICGNGGSAADAQHIAAEFVGRYETERRGLPAIALTTDTSALTALANDYDFERVFARQIESLASGGDCLIAISTSGNSPNVIAAVMEARRKGCRILGMTGSNGKRLAGLSDVCLMVPSTRTARIQEGHITVAHIWCEMVDTWASRDESGAAG